MSCWKRLPRLEKSRNIMKKKAQKRSNARAGSAQQAGAPMQPKQQSQEVAQLKNETRRTVSIGRPVPPKVFALLKERAANAKSFPAASVQEDPGDQAAADDEQMSESEPCTSKQSKKEKTDGSHKQ